MAKGDMNPHVKRKWVKALRSGEYEQTVGELVDGVVDDSTFTPSYCCLGVLLAECRPESIQVKKDYGYTYLGVKEFDTPPNISLVADDLAILWGVTEEHQEVLSNMNDDGKSFSAIADYIEENL